MKTLRSIGVAGALGIAVTACSSSNAPMGGVTPGAADQVQGGMRNAIGPNSVLSQISIPRGWMSPETTKQKELVYVSCLTGNEIAIDSGYTYLGKITDGINEPQGLATDNKGNLYVANLGGKTITVYPPGATSPSLTLTDSDGPDDVAVGSNGYVYASDVRGGIDVYPPGGTSPIRRLHNSAIGRHATGVGVDASNNVFATGRGRSSGPAVVKFANGSGSGTNLGLSGLRVPAGVIIDKNNNLVVSDRHFGILIYPPGQTSPSRQIRIRISIHSWLNGAGNLIYIPSTDEYVFLYDYPSFTYITGYTAGGLTVGAASTP